MEILKEYDGEVINISSNIYLYYLEDEKDTVFYISVDGNVQIVSKIFYVNIQSSGVYPTSKGRALKVLTDDGDYRLMWVGL